ncbi:hypothetical protein GGE41_003822 [Agrobacterium tumefaciens]|nr:hypothetical protein [Agrobacterium radiobacter]MBB4458831.1 hypothetical protein [Agrobacterium radiobacter]MBB4463272.1 hypothetical protein [Agrobacterium radiobacter]MBB4487535.1 hypothetical protein [Agrobacterium radiobacter]
MSIAMGSNSQLIRANAPISVVSFGNLDVDALRSDNARAGGPRLEAVLLRAANAPVGRVDANRQAEGEPSRQPCACGERMVRSRPTSRLTVPPMMLPPRSAVSRPDVSETLPAAVIEAFVSVSS